VSDSRDAVVVGGGPAGSACAILLRQAGWDVVLLDAARFPRDKVCGEGVSPEAWRLLAAIGATQRVRALAPQPLRGMTLRAPDGTEVRGDYEGERLPGFAVRRARLDAALLENARAAGVEVREATRATGVLREGGRAVGVALEDGSRLPARLLVGADGRQSLVARQLGLLRRPRYLRKFAVRGYWQYVAGLEARGEMHVAPGAYCGVAPLSATEANVAFVLDRRSMPGAAGDLEGFYRRTLERRWPHLAERLARARLLLPPRAIGPLAVEARGVAAPGAVLVGDAAGFYDPFTGEGVTLALRSAELAAETATEWLAGRGDLRRYARQRDEATRDKFRFNRLLQHLIHWPELADLAAHRLARRKKLADRLVGIAGDFVPARSALSLGFVWELLRA